MPMVLVVISAGFVASVIAARLLQLWCIIYFWIGLLTLFKESLQLVTGLMYFFIDVSTKVLIHTIVTSSEPQRHPQEAEPNRGNPPYQHEQPQEIAASDENEDTLSADEARDDQNSEIHNPTQTDNVYAPNSKPDMAISTTHCPSDVPVRCCPTSDDEVVIIGQALKSAPASSYKNVHEEREFAASNRLASNCIFSTLDSDGDNIRPPRHGLKLDEMVHATTYTKTTIHRDSNHVAEPPYDHSHAILHPNLESGAGGAKCEAFVSDNAPITPSRVMPGPILSSDARPHINIVPPSGSNDDNYFTPVISTLHCDKMHHHHPHPPKSAKLANRQKDSDVPRAKVATAKPRVVVAVVKRKRKAADCEPPSSGKRRHKVEPTTMTIKKE